MRRSLISSGALLIGCSFVVIPQNIAVADPDCATADEFNQVNLGMTRSHVQGDIFDGYTGWQFWSASTDNADFIYKNYAKCVGNNLFQIEYRLDTTPDSDGRWHVIETNVYDPDAKV